MYTTYAKVMLEDPAITMAQADVENIIRAVSSYIDQFCNQKIASDQSVAVIPYYFDGSGTESIVFHNALNGSPVMNEVALDGSVTIDTYVRFYPLNAPYKTYAKKTVGKFTDGNGNYSVSGCWLGMYKYNWSTPAQHTLPEDITQVCTKIVVNTVREAGIVASDNEKSGKISSETMGSYSVSYATDASNISKSVNSVLNATNVLNSYKNPANIV